MNGDTTKRLLLCLVTLLALGGATLPAAHARRVRAAEGNKAIVRRVLEEINKGNVGIVDELYAPTFLSHGRTAAEDTRGPQSYRQFVEVIRAAFPDLQFTVEDQIAEGDKVVTRYSFHGTHTGEFRGSPIGTIPATGKPATVMGISIVRIADGKIVENWGLTDTLGLLRQIGAVPSAAPARTNP